MTDRRLVALILGLATPVALSAQAPDAGIFQMKQGTAEVGRESFRRSSAQFDQESVIPVLNLRFTGSAQRTPRGASPVSA